MDVALRELNLWYASQGLPTCAARIGIDTGSLVAGSLGSAERLKYTVVGNAAVTAQRLESTGAVEHDFERSACRILASEHTCELLDDSFETQSVGAIPLKGKREPLRVWRILGRAR